jgi:hypothetical protein
MLGDYIQFDWHRHQTSSFHPSVFASNMYNSISCSNKMPSGAALVFRPTNAVRCHVLHLRVDDPVIVVAPFVSVNDSISLYPVLAADVALIPNCRKYRVT